MCAHFRAEGASSKFAKATKCIVQMALCIWLMGYEKVSIDPQNCRISLESIRVGIYGYCYL